ncbi:MAG TPA: hypothetical protein VHD37_03010 [Candidatus Paceibacterota bacterium]|nr:hypothetical protein [Candidatus Paceibacterota bacterium]
MDLGAAVTTSSKCVESARAFAGCMADVVINPILALLFATGLVLFIWGLAEFTFGLSASGGEGKEKGKQHMLWGIIGMFIMAGAFSIIKIIANTLGPEATKYLH